MKHEYIIGSIRVSNPTSSTMEGTYSIWGVAELDCDSSIVIKETIDLQVDLTVRAKDDNDMQSQVDIRNALDVDFEMVVKQGGRLNTPSRLIVTPKNSMWGQYEVIEPLPIIQTVYAEKDTYIRSQRPRVNYGREASLIVGNNFGDEYRTLIKYDFKDIPQDVEIRKATMVLKGIENISQFLINIHHVLDPWDEYSTTWVNSPRIGDILKEFESGHTVNEIRVDITDLFFGWRDGLIENNGMYLIKKDMDEVGTRTYGSKESNIFHYVEVEYLDPNLYSFNNAYTWGMFEVSPYVDLGGTIDIIPTEWEHTEKAQLYVRDSSRMPASILVNKPNLQAEMTVKHANHMDLKSTIRVPEYGDDDFLHGKIQPRAIGNLDLISKLIVEFKQLMDAQFEVRPTLSIPSTLMIPYPMVYDGLEGTIEIMDGFNTKSEITVSTVFETPSSLVVSTIDDIPSELFVKYEQGWDAQLRVTPVIDLPSSITVRADGTVDWGMQFTATTFKDFPSKVEVNPYSDLASKLGVKTDGETSWEGKIEVDYGLNVKASLLVRGDDIPSVIRVRQEVGSDIPSEFLIRYDGHIDLNGTLNPKVFGNADVEGQLKPRVSKYHSQQAYLWVRVSDSIDLDVTLNVEAIKFKGYVFIM